jgi:transcriptional regulator with XRE-family HTH domain
MSFSLLTKTMVKKPSSEDPQHLGKRLKEVLKANHISMQQLADRCGVTRPAVSHWSKHGSISRKHINQVATICGTTVEFLLTGDQQSTNGYSYTTEDIARRLEAKSKQQHKLLYTVFDILLQLPDIKVSDYPFLKHLLQR